MYVSVADATAWRCDVLIYQYLMRILAEASLLRPSGNENSHRNDHCP